MEEVNPNTSEIYLLNSTSVCVCVCVCVCARMFFFFFTTHLLLCYCSVKNAPIHSLLHFIHGMHRDSFNFIILGLHKFEVQKSTKIRHLYISCNIKIFDSETSKYFNTSCIYTMLTLKLIFHHLRTKISVQDSKIMSL